MKFIDGGDLQIGKPLNRENNHQNNNNNNNNNNQNNNKNASSIIINYIILFQLDYSSRLLY